MAVVGEAGKQVQHLSSTTGHDCQQALWMIIVLPINPVLIWPCKLVVAPP